MPKSLKRSGAIFWAASIALFPAVRVSLLAQWTTNSNGSISPTGGAAVGIGTSTPDGALQVDGLFHLKRSSQSLYIGTSGDVTDTGGGNTFVGHQAGNANTNAWGNTALGALALRINTAGYANTAIGESTLISNTSGFYNTAVGTGALYYNTTGGNNVAIGSSSLSSNTTGIWNTAIGVNALGSVTTGSDNTALGLSTGIFSTGSDNVFVGREAGHDGTTGNANVVVGSAAGRGMGAGGNNVYIGAGAGFSATGSGNIFIGQNAGSSPSPANLSNKLYIANSGDNTGHSGLLLYGDFSSGMIGIGTSAPCTTNAPANCRLSVNGGVQAQEVVVNTGWADYVFDPSYHLQSLDEVRDYVAANHHLAGIPSAAEVAQKGVNLGEMQSTLLAKIEELTLHVIHADEQIKKLQLQNDEMRQLISGESHK